MSEMKNWKEILKYVRNYIAVFSSQYVPGGFHWESSLFIYSFRYFYTFRVFLLLHKEKDSLRQQTSLGAAVSFLLVFCSFALSSFIKQCPPPRPRLMKTLETEDLHSPESCTVPYSGPQCSLFQGWLKARQVSCQSHWCFRQTLQRAFHSVFIPSSKNAWPKFAHQMQLTNTSIPKDDTAETQGCIYLMQSLWFIHSEFIPIPYLSTARGNVFYYSIFKTAFDGSH